VILLALLLEFIMIHGPLNVNSHFFAHYCITTKTIIVSTTNADCGRTPRSTAPYTKFNISTLR